MKLLGKKTDNMISIVEIMQFMTHNSLHLYKKKGSRAPLSAIISHDKIEETNPYHKGAIFVSSSKVDLMQGKGYVVTSYETLQEKQQQLSHWTPNTYRGGTYYSFKDRVIKGHSRDNLKQVNVIGIDIDSKEVDLYGLYLACEKLKLPRPNLLLETPRGFQSFFVLETPFYIKNDNNYKSLRIAERLSHNIRKALSAYFPIDINCAPFGFYRIPREDNVLDFYEEPANTSQLISWSQDFERKEKRNFSLFLCNKDESIVDQTSSAWYRALIQTKDIEKGHHSASRNNTLLTLALANYSSGRSYEDAYDELDQFNSQLNTPLHKNEFERTLKSAYSGRYKGVKRSYVDGLLEIWTDGQVKFRGKEGWYKFKKQREKRVRSHYSEWERDICTYLDINTSPEMPFLEVSLNTLANKVGLAVSSLKEVMKRSKVLIKNTVGRGRGAVTKWTTRSMLLKSLLKKRKEKKKYIQMTFSKFIMKQQQQCIVSCNPELNKYPINSEELVVDVKKMGLLGLSPPG